MVRVDYPPHQGVGERSRPATFFDTMPEPDTKAIVSGTAALWGIRNGTHLRRCGDRTRRSTLRD